MTFLGSRLEFNQSSVSVSLLVCDKNVLSHKARGHLRPRDFEKIIVELYPKFYNSRITHFQKF